MAKAVEEADTDNAQQEDTVQDNAQKQVKSVEFSEVDGADASGAGGSIDILLDINIPVTVAIGKAEIPVRRLLQLGPGSVLKLGKPIDEPADLYLKDTKFALASVVVVDDRFAVRIKQILGLGDSAAKPAETARE